MMMSKLPGAGEAGELAAQAGIDQDDLIAAAHHQHVQRPVERLRRQEHILEPGGPIGRIGIGRQRGGRQRQHAVAHYQHVEIPYPQRIARRNQFFGARTTGLRDILQFHRCPPHYRPNAVRTRLSGHPIPVDQAEVLLEPYTSIGSIIRQILYKISTSLY
jgi:hypothetical protein